MEIRDESEPGLLPPLPPAARRAPTLLGVQPWEPADAPPRELPSPQDHQAAPVLPAPVDPTARASVASLKTTLAGVTPAPPLAQPAQRTRHNVLTSVPTRLGWQPEPVLTPASTVPLDQLADSAQHAPVSERIPDTEPAPPRASAAPSPSPAAVDRHQDSRPQARTDALGALDRVSEHNIARVVAVTRFIDAHPVGAAATALLTGACTLYGAYGLVHHLVRIVAG